MDSKNVQCRLCASFSEKNVIADSNKCNDLSVTENIATFFNIKILFDDSFSKYICESCIAVIDFIHEQRKFFQESQKYLETTDEDKCKDIMKMSSDDDSNKDEKKYPIKVLHTNRQNYDKILVPLIYFCNKNPRVLVSSRERNAASALLRAKDEMQNKILFERVDLKNNVKYRTIQKITKTKHSSEKSYVVRDLVKEGAALNAEHYDVANEANNVSYKKWKNFKPEDLFFTSMQFKVYVCYLCNEVFEKKCQMNSHLKEHGTIDFR